MEPELRYSIELNCKINPDFPKLLNENFGVVNQKYNSVVVRIGDYKIMVSDRGTVKIVPDSITYMDRVRLDTIIQQLADSEAIQDPKIDRLVIQCGTKYISLDRSNFEKNDIGYSTRIDGFDIFANETKEDILLFNYAETSNTESPRREIEKFNQHIFEQLDPEILEEDPTMPRFVAPNPTNN